MKITRTMMRLAVALIICFPAVQALAQNGAYAVADTKFTINVVDLIPALGFSDPTQAEPVGGNPGTTIGQQRLEAYFEAARIWQDALDVDQQVVIQAIFFPLSCAPNFGVLGAAGALTLFRDFEGPSFPSTWYAAALSNELAGEDLGGTEPDPGFQAPPFNDEIFSLFNSVLGSPGCLENSGWYYGLDGENPPGTIDFLAVLVHEIGHGLGFQNFADDFTGANFLGYPDQWSRFQYDNLIGKQWGQMVDAVRAFSTTNGPNLVWAGPAVTAAAPTVLDPAQVILFNPPSTLAGLELPFGTANFGPPVPAGGLTGDVMLVDDGDATPSDGCEAIVNDLTGMIALIDRGSCTFVVKAQNAQAAGAIGIIIANNQPGAEPIGLGGSEAPGTEPVVVPTVSVSLDGGQALRAYPGTNITIGVDSSQGTLAGVAPNGLVKLYAPFPARAGSSVAHFDVSASPNLLMEPSISNDLDPAGRGVDLTDELLKDIGWDGRVTCPVTSRWWVSQVNVFGLPTGVPNRRGTYTVLGSKGNFPTPFGRPTASGCYLQDVIDACAPAFRIDGLGGQYQSCIAQVTQNLWKQGHLGKAEADAIQQTATLVVPLLNSL